MYRGLKKSLNSFLEESSILREYLGKYWKLVGVGILALVVVDGLEIFPPLLLKRTVDLLEQGKAAHRLFSIAVIYFALSIGMALGRYAWRMYLVRASLLSGRDLRGRYVGHLFGLSASFFDRTPIGDLMSLNISDVDSVRMMIGGGLITLADSLFYFATIPIAMFWLSPKLALIAFVPLPIIPWLVMKNEKLIHERYKKVQESFGLLSSMTQEALNGIRVTKGFAQEDALLRRFEKAGKKHVELSLKLGWVQAVFGPEMDFFMSGGLVLLLYFGGRGIIQHSDHFVTLGTFVAFQRYIQKMIWPMMAFGMAIANYQRAITSSDRLKTVFVESTDTPEIQNAFVPRDAKLLSHQTSGMPGIRGKVEFKNLTFAYPGTTNNVLSNINLTVEAGERVAWVGSVGSGKTALLSLLPRLYPVSRGMLFIDNVDVNDWSIESLRKQVGYVGQDLFLFSDTVLENIAYGLYEWSDVQDATQLACVHEDLEGLTESYSTRVGERGVTLSGGQKQRLTIARAIIKKPPILVLDDALSSVDVQTEEKILSGLRSRPGRNTELIAAHRISTIRDADRIVVIEGGAVCQQGTHKELIKERKGKYRLFYDQQLMREDLENYAAQIEIEGPRP